ncbi:hypothetical protein PAXINDRAFT_19429 [Paxillus involutus ATCC 200175]|uniref:Uncharacterized protein n=1 Tax=Paxillus involutus ATCC 200175 TaxID=664439 RepID=A0A0C9SN63_PAXIN|nr:hypothetical protein PAXINDRAFT_19429 [Paxillus involutus ATCC 200175]
MPLPFPQWVSAFKRAEKDPARVKTGIVDTGYRFPEPVLIVAPVLPERRKLYCANWLAAQPLWISRVEHHPPCPLPVPQTWRDFLNTIPSALLADNTTTKSAREKLAAKSLFGNALVHLQGNTWATQGDVSWRNQRIAIATLEDPPAHLIRCILWEIYELGFRYELLDLDRAMVPGLWTEAPAERTELLYSIFPGESGLVMWQEDMPTTEQGMWASPATAYPFLESWRKLLSAWPEAPSRLCSPIVQESFSSVVQSEILSSACMFYVQTFFDLFGRPPIVTHRVLM